MTVGDISTLLVWGAMTAFTVGFLAYTADLGRLAEARTPDVVSSSMRRRSL